jgi:hypothetical protein
MYKHTVTLECIVNQAGIEFTYHEVFECLAHNPYQYAVSKAISNRYAREHRGLVSCKAVRTSVERVRSVA